jgi:hypothetical protein
MKSSGVVPRCAQERLKAIGRECGLRGAVCRLLAINLGSLAGIVGSQVGLLAPNVGRKCLLFASPRATVCEPLQLAVGLDHLLQLA